MKGQSIIEDLKNELMEDDKKSPKFFGSTIIYCPTKKVTEDIYTKLKGYF